MTLLVDYHNTNSQHLHPRVTSYTGKMVHWAPDIMYVWSNRMSSDGNYIHNPM